MKHFKKKSKSDVLSNFEASTSPKSHLNNCIIGSVNRISSACTDDNCIKKSIEKLKINLKKNSFPEKLINEKINYALKKERKIEQEYDRTLYLSLDFTSKRCSIIQKELIEIVRKFLPKFRLVISWKAIRTITNTFQLKLKEE